MVNRHRETYTHEKLYGKVPDYKNGIFIQYRYRKSQDIRSGNGMHVPRL